MLSNRESARRSRRRKQQHLGELQTRVGELQGENAALLEKLHALHVSFDDVMNRNRTMKESLAYLRAQVVSGGVVTPEVLRAAQTAVEEGDAAEAAMAAALARSGGVGVGAAAAAGPHSRGMPHPGMPAGMYAADAGAAMHLVGGMSAASLGTRAMVNPAGALAAPGGLGHHASWAAAVVADGIGAPRGGGGPDVKSPRGLGLGGAVAMHAHAQVGAGGVVPAGVAVGVVPAGVAVTKKGRAKHTNFPLHHAAPEQLLHANAAHAGYNARRGSSHQNQTLPPASHQGRSGRGVGGSQTSSLTRAVQNPSPERSADDPSGGSVSVGDLARGGVQGGGRGARRGGGARAAGNTAAAAAAAAVADQAAMAAQMERQRLAALGDPLGGGEEPRGGGGGDDDELGMRLMASARRGAAVQGRGLLVGHGGSPGGGDFSLPSVAGEAMAAARRAAARGLANQQGSDGSRADAGSSGPESAGNSGDDGRVLRGEGSEFRGRGDEVHGHGGSFAPQNEQSRLDDDAAAAAALTADVVAGAVAGALDVTPEKMAGFEAMGAQFLAGAPGDADAQLEGLHHGVAAAPDVAALESTVDDWFNAEAGGGAEGGDKGNKMGRTESMNRVASLEHMAKRGAHERVR